jgi:hypothetical protein
VAGGTIDDQIRETGAARSPWNAWQENFRTPDICLLETRQSPNGSRLELCATPPKFLLEEPVHRHPDLKLFNVKATRLWYALNRGERQCELDGPRTAKAITDIGSSNVRPHNHLSTNALTNLGDKPWTCTEQAHLQTVSRTSSPGTLKSGFPGSPLLSSRSLTSESQ